MESSRKEQFVQFLRSCPADVTTEEILERLDGIDFWREDEESSAWTKWRMRMIRVLVKEAGKAEPGLTYYNVVKPPKEGTDKGERSYMQPLLMGFSEFDYVFSELERKVRYFQGEGRRLLAKARRSRKLSPTQKKSLTAAYQSAFAFAEEREPSAEAI